MGRGAVDRAPNHDKSYARFSAIGTPKNGEVKRFRPA
jgi:hypothetical protein